MVKTQNASDYEMSREKRIQENRERMEKLGIFDLSLQMKSLKPSLKRNLNRKNQLQSHSPLPRADGPIRRSSRLQNSTPVSYCEAPLPKKEKSLKDDNLTREEGAKPEIYTEEHEKLLGSTEIEWELFVDGYGKDGRRIYDSIKGKTCHQCRQKTLGHRTHCCKCNLVQGQFCGDCLYMRYGENVLEAKANPEWTCPVCRGICNCSLCRQAKGWAPTGPLYKKISNLGYKSVAHYLVQTRLASKEDSDENDASTKATVSAKRSLPFSDSDVRSEEDNNLSKSNLENTLKEEDNLSKSNLENTLKEEDNLSKSNLENTSKEEDKGSNEKHDVCIEIADPLVEPDVTTIQLEDESKQLLNPEKEENGSACDEKKEDDDSIADNIKLDESVIETKVASNEKIASSTCEAVLGKEGNGDKETNGEDDGVTISDEQYFLAAQELSPISSTKGKKRKIFEPSTYDSIASRLRQRRSNNKTCA